MADLTVEQRLARLERWAASFGRSAGKPAASNGASKPAAPAGDVASDKDLDGEHGDPVVRRDPPKWKGGSYVGLPYSKTEPAYLEEMASFLCWKANKNQEEGDPDRAKFIAYDRKDAARARGWAARLRSKGSPAPAAPAADSFSGGFDGDDEIPF